MYKTRMILGFLSLGLAAGHLALAQLGWSTSFAGILLHFAGGTMLASSLIILAFSFLKVETAADGSLRYDPANPYWKAMRKFFGTVWGDQVSLCNAFWGTCLLIMIGGLFVLAVAGVLFIVIVIGSDIVRDPVTFGERLSIVGVMPILTVLSKLGFFFALIWSIGQVIAQIDWKKRFLRPVGYCLAAGGIAVACAVINGATVSGAMLGLLAFVGFLVGVILSVFLVVRAAYGLVSSLQGTWLAHALASAKARACPILTAAAPADARQNG